MRTNLIILGMLITAYTLYKNQSTIRAIQEKCEERRISRNIYLDNITLDVYDDF